MKKGSFSMIAVFLLTLAMAGNVCLAADKSAATKNSLQSNGRICYQDGEETVIMDSDDLYLLADRLDLFKAGVVEQLGAMHTYLSKDSTGVPLLGTDGVYAGHKKPSAQNTLNPVFLDFDTILEGIAASQSIPLEPTAYGLTAGTKLYKGENGKLLKSQAEGAAQISIQAATAENLSAGTAAWVNGELLLGTGGDVVRMYEEKNQNVGGGEEWGTYEISEGYTLPADVSSAFAYVVTTGSASSGVDGNHAGKDPTFTVNGGGRYTQLFEKRYASNGYNVRIALYHVMNAPAGTEITGSNGLLFY